MNELYVYCPTCNGNGWIGSIWQPCPVCDGETCVHVSGRNYFDETEVNQTEREENESTISQ